MLVFKSLLLQAAMIDRIWDTCSQGQSSHLFVDSSDDLKDRKYFCLIDQAIWFIAVEAAILSCKRLNGPEHVNTACWHGQSFFKSLCCRICGWSSRHCICGLLICTTLQTSSFRCKPHCYLYHSRYTVTVTCCNRFVMVSTTIANLQDRRDTFGWRKV